MEFDKGIVCTESETGYEATAEETPTDLDEPKDVVTRVQALRHLDDLKLFFESNGLDTVPLEEQQNIVFEATSTRQSKITDFFKKLYVPFFDVQIVF